MPGWAGRAFPWAASTLALCFAACQSKPAPAVVASPGRWCDSLPRPVYKTLERVPVRDDWFEVYRVAEGVFAISEPFQFQEVISYLVLGSKEALLFDTGMGMAPIAPVVKELTALPVTVLNSHTHFDHVGGNAEFARVLAMDTPYTRANTRGFAHEALKGEVAPEAFCRMPPAGFDAGAYRTRPWTATAFIKDGYRIDLGGRWLEVLHVPGHTPDAVAVLDAGGGLLLTGDTFYESTIWLVAPETDLAAYEASVDRLAALVPRLKKLLPAHNGAVAAPQRLLELREAVAGVRSGRSSGKVTDQGGILFALGPFSILTSPEALAGGTDSLGQGGGSGLPPGPSLVPPAAPSPNSG